MCATSRRRLGSTVQPLVPLTSGSRLSRGRWLTAERQAPASSPTLSRRRIALAIVGLALMGAGAAAGASAMAAEETANGNLCIENASLAELQQALAEGRTTATALTRAYLARIEAYDRAGPTLNSVREINPDALPIAASFDRIKPNPKQPLAGIPILVKDNIATGDKQHTTAGSLALAEARAKRDAALVARLRAAGAVILGKANLTEFANILAIDMPAGYSSLGGQVKNPYAPGLDDKGVPVVSPGGSSSGSAVAVAAGLAAAAIGTETSGSLLSPATQNGVVTVKPTVGLISRTGILPIAHSQDTAGPLTRTVRDAAILLNVPARRSVVFVYELKHDLNTYLRDWLTGTQMHTMADIIAFNAAHAEKALRFGQDIFVAAEATRGDLSELEYKSARAMDLRASRALGLDSYMDKYRLDAVLFPGVAGAAIAAKAGYPSVQVPAGFLRGNEMPEYPLGATFTGRAWSEPTLLRIAYAFERATKARQMPPGVPPLDEGCAR